MITIKLTPQQKAKYVKLGAGRWVKGLLNEAPPECKTPEQKQAYAFGWFSACQFLKTAQPAPQIPAGMCLVPLTDERINALMASAGPMSNYDFHAPGASPDADHAEWLRAMIAAHNIKEQL